MTISRTPARKAAETRRDEIVAVVLELLAEGDVSAVSTPAIARRVGVTQSALYKHFRSKEDIWRAVMDVIAVDVGGRLRQAMQTDGSRADRLFAILAAYLSAVLEIPAIPALMFAGEVRALDGASYLREEISQRFGWFHSALAEQIRAGQTDGEFRSDFDAQAAAALAAGIAQSAILRWRLGGNRIDMMGDARMAFPIFLAGVRATS